jgi:hypothetical protein
MSYTTKSKYVRVPFYINKANGMNDNFTVSFKPKSATQFRASDEFTKFIDDDYTKFLQSSLKNSNAARDFTMRGKETQTDPEIRRPGAPIEAEYDTPWFNIGIDSEEPPTLEPTEEEQIRALEERVARMSEMGRGMTSNDTFFDAEEGSDTFYSANEGDDDVETVIGDGEGEKRKKLNPTPVIKTITKPRSAKAKKKDAKEKEAKQEPILEIEKPFDSDRLKPTPVKKTIAKQTIAKAKRQRGIKQLKDAEAKEAKEEEELKKAVRENLETKPSQVTIPIPRRPKPQTPKDKLKKAIRESKVKAVKEERERLQTLERETREIEEKEKEKATLETEEKEKEAKTLKEKGEVMLKLFRGGSIIPNFDEMMKNRRIPPIVIQSQIYYRGVNPPVDNNEKGFRGILYKMIEQMKKSGQWYTKVSDERLAELTLEFRSKYGNLPQEQDDDIGGLKRQQKEQLSPAGKKTRPTNPTPAEADTVRPGTNKEDIDRAREGDTIVLRIDKLMNDNNFTKKALQQQLAMRGIEFETSSSHNQLKELVTALIKDNPTVFENELEEETIVKNLIDYTRGGKRPLPIPTDKWDKRLRRRIPK